MNNPLKIVFPAIAILTFAIAAHAAEPLQLNGAGATFPFPLYSKWFSDYSKATGVNINYQSIGSGGGIRQLLDKTVDFGASDAPMNDEQLAKATPSIIHIPTVLGAVVLTYNIPGVTQSLDLTPEVIAGIYLGKITKWNDPAIAGMNKGVVLPDLPILAAYRSDGSGTTAVFTDYLAKVSPDWKSTVGNGTSVKWPVGLGGKGNEGVTGLIKQSPGSIGYVELVYAESNKLPFAKVKNSSGKFVTPSPATITAAAAGAVKEMPADFRVSITNAPGKEAYPISSFTYLLVYRQMPGEKGAAFVKFLNWAVTDGQKTASTLSYAPLPKPLITKIQARIKEIKTN